MSLHIITSKVPDRYSYDGSADMYWKIIAFQKAGIDCILHIIHRPAAIQDAIRVHCSKIYFYERAKGHSSFSLKAPISVNRMYNQHLLERLKEDNDPIFFDGIQTTFYLTLPEISKRVHFIQIRNTFSKKHHNIFNLNNSFSAKTNEILKSLVYTFYQKNIFKKAWILSEHLLNHSTLHDDTFKKLILPPFIGLPISRSQPGLGNYCILHGDFKDPMTSNFAIWLLDQIFSKIDIPLVVAGKYPSNKLEIAAHRKLHTCLVADPSEPELTELISKSQICIHFSLKEHIIDQSTILSMQYGRHIIKIEDEIIQGMEAGKEALMNQIKMTFTQPYSEDDLEIRAQELHKLSQDTASVSKIKSIINEYCR